MTKKERALLAIELLKQVYPDAICSLNYEKPHELLISTRLAAQCTDARVNIVTKDLYQKYQSLEDFASADLAELEEMVRPCGFYHTKAKDIIAMSQMLLDQYDGVLPDTVEELTKLPGVGRKTANLIVGDIYHKPAIVCDTHCIRITNLLGLTTGKDPAKVEDQLRKLLPPEESNDFLSTALYCSVGNTAKPGRPAVRNVPFPPPASTMRTHISPPVLPTEPSEPNCHMKKSGSPVCGSPDLFLHIVFQSELVHGFNGHFIGIFVEVCHCIQDHLHFFFAQGNTLAHTGMLRSPFTDIKLGFPVIPAHQIEFLVQPLALSDSTQISWTISYLISAIVQPPFSTYIKEGKISPHPAYPSYAIHSGHHRYLPAFPAASASW